MAFKGYFAALIICLFFASSLAQAQAQKSCGDLFGSVAAIKDDGVYVSEKTKKKILRFMDLLGAGDPTALRQEDKYVVDAKTVQSFLQKLSSKYRESFQLRDLRIAGRKNVTVTEYALPFKWIDANGYTLSAKFREREYFDTDESLPLGQAAGHRAQITSDKVWVELKTDHPVHTPVGKNVVFKPRVLMLKNDADALKDSAKFHADKSAILARTLEINSKLDPEIPRLFINILSDIYSDLKVKNLPMLATTAYIRDSYSLLLEKNGGKENPLEVQITIDREIQVKDGTSQQVISAYRPEDIVVEVKVPLNYAGLNAQNISQVPGLVDVLNLKKTLTSEHQDSRYELGAGKLSTFKKVQQNLKELVGD
jgi:hypothetical protein